MTSPPDWKVYLSDLTFDRREEEAVLQVLRSGWLTMGPRTQEFERLVAQYVHAPHAVALANCTAGLYLLLRSMDLAPGDEVLLPALTFVATANVVLNCGAVPVFCDIVAPDLPLIDPKEIGKKLTSRTRAVYTVDYAGVPCDYDAIRAILDSHESRMRAQGSPESSARIRLFEDAAHGIGGRLDETRYLGNCADAGVYSFFSNKNLVTGEGGMIVTTDPAIDARVRSLRSHGLTHSTWSRHQGGTPGYDVVDAGWNFRPTEIMAALGLVQLARLEACQRRRAVIVERYRERLRELPEITVPFAQGGYWAEPANHIFPILLPGSHTRDRVRQHLLDRRIQISHHYNPIHLFQYYRDRVPTARVRLPRTEAYADCELTLPLHPGLHEDQVDWIVDEIREALSG